MFEQFEGRPSAHGAHGMRLQCQNKHKNRTPRTASPPLPGAPRRSSTVRSALASSSNRLRVFGVAASSGPAQQKAGHSPHALTLQGRPQARACFARRLARRCLHCAIIATARRTLLCTTAVYTHRLAARCLARLYSQRASASSPRRHVRHLCLLP